MSEILLGQDDVRKPFTAGTYPAHIVKLEAREVKTGLKIFDITYRIDEKAGNMVVEDEEGNKIHATHMVGKEFRHARIHGIWLNTDPAPDERWKNGRYKEFFEMLEVKFQKKEIDGKEYTVLHEVDEIEIFGTPVWIKILPETDKNDPEKKYFKVFEVKLRDGEKLTYEKLNELENNKLNDEIPF